MVAQAREGFTRHCRWCAKRREPQDHFEELRETVLVPKERPSSSQDLRRRSLRVCLPRSGVCRRSCSRGSTGQLAPHCRQPHIRVT